VRLVRVNEAFRLIHVDFFGQLGVEECGVNVHLMDFKVECCGESEKEM
jgi:hypothetical protein